MAGTLSATVREHLDQQRIVTEDTARLLRRLVTAHLRAGAAA